MPGRAAGGGKMKNSIGGTLARIMGAGVSPIPRDGG
jgi:hypothetical protein